MFSALSSCASHCSMWPLFELVKSLGNVQVNWIKLEKYPYRQTLAGTVYIEVQRCNVVTMWEIAWALFQIARYTDTQYLWHERFMLRDINNSAKLCPFDVTAFDHWLFTLSFFARCLQDICAQLDGKFSGSTTIIVYYLPHKWKTVLWSRRLKFILCTSLDSNHNPAVTQIGFD